MAHPVHNDTLVSNFTYTLLEIARKYSCATGKLPLSIQSDWMINYAQATRLTRRWFAKVTHHCTTGVCYRGYKSTTPTSGQPSFALWLSFASHRFACPQSTRCHLRINLRSSPSPSLAQCLRAPTNRGPDGSSNSCRTSSSCWFWPPCLPLSSTSSLSSTRRGCGRNLPSRSTSSLEWNTPRNFDWPNWMAPR